MRLGLLLCTIILLLPSVNAMTDPSDWETDPLQLKELYTRKYSKRHCLKPTSVQGYTPR